MSEASLKRECPTCGSDDPKKFYAFSTAFGGKWIPWFWCPDKWHLEHKGPTHEHSRAGTYAVAMLVLRARKQSLEADLLPVRQAALATFGPILDAGYRAGTLAVRAAQARQAQRVCRDVKVLLFQVDGKFPNFALMRLARYHRDRGNEVFLTPFLRDVRFVQADLIYSSSIFEFSSERRSKFAEIFPQAIVGGDGYKPIWNQLHVIGRNIGSNLREVITDRDPELIPADYSDYPNFMASVGYSQRGCRLDCAFCRMKTREGEARKVQGIFDLWRGEPWPKHIVLLDNDFFGQVEWREQLQEVKKHKFRICFNQGINIRLINEEQAAELSTVFYADDQFKTRRLYTAWDNLGDEKIFKAGVATMVKAGIPAKHLMVYMLIGFRKGETEQEILYRFNEMVALGCRPYPMVFDRKNARLRAFQRWVIRRYYEIVPWEQYGNEPKQASGSSQEVLEFL